MTPTQRVKCDLLGISVLPWETALSRAPEPALGYYVTLNLPNNMWAVLCTPDGTAVKVSWPSKRFKTVSSAIEAASNPSKHGLAWDN